MRLIQARVQNFRCILDSGWFDVEDTKTVIVGANESGKTALLDALVRLNPPAGVRGYDAAVDLPRRSQHAEADVADLPVATARFSLDVDEVPAAFSNARYVVQRTMGNRARHWIEGGPAPRVFDQAVLRDAQRLAAHADRRTGGLDHAGRLRRLTSTWLLDTTTIDGDRAASFDAWVDSVRRDVDPDDRVALGRLQSVEAITSISHQRQHVLDGLAQSVPMFVYFDGHFSAGRAINIADFAARYDEGFASPTQQDIADLALFRLLGMSPRELANIEAGQAGLSDDPDASFAARDRRLAEVSDRLTAELYRVWQPTDERLEADSLGLVIDNGYLRLRVIDPDGTEIPFEQRSSGFRWLVSFLIVFLSESGTTLTNAVLMLDEPGMRLHPRKQADFRITLDRLAGLHQMLFTTHSPYLIGPSDLASVRTVEHIGVDEGTQVHNTDGAMDPAATLPLVESVAVTISDQLFRTQRGLLCARLSDYWYVSAVAELLRSDGDYLDDVEVIVAGPIAHLVVLSGVLRNRGVHVVALLDNDAAGVAPEVVAKRVRGTTIVRPAAGFDTAPLGAGVEDLLRNTLIRVAADELGIDVGGVADDQPILEALEAASPSFDRTHLAQVFVDWASRHRADDLDPADRDRWQALADEVRFALAG